MASFTQAQLDALEAAIAEGTRVVRYADKSVEYRSMAEMLQARDLIRKSLGLTPGIVSRINPVTSKGLN